MAEAATNPCPHCQRWQAQLEQLQATVARLEEQLAEVQRQLKEVEASVPANLRSQYNRVVASLGADALAAVHDRTCSACHTEITAQNYNDLQQELFVSCKSCGRILYPPEQPAITNP